MPSILIRPAANPVANNPHDLHSLAAECAVLGAIFADADALGSAREQKLLADDFFLPAHAMIFRRMEELAAAGAPIDSLTLGDELVRAGELQAIGGASYLQTLARSVPQEKNAAHYARIVHDYACRRAVIRETAALYQFSLDPSAEPETIFRWVEALAAHWKAKAEIVRALPVTTGAEEAAGAGEAVEWIARPIVAAGAITEISGKVKQAGKTTFVTHLAAAVLDGKDFLGQPTKKSAVVYLTEQPPATFRLAMNRAGLVGREDFAIVYWNRAAGMAWEELAGLALAECQRRGARLLVVDTLAQFAGITGESENFSGDALRAMQPLQRAAAEGLGVIVVRQERKSGGAVGDSGRGSSAYAGAVDIVVSLRAPEGNAEKNLRVMQAVSRFDDVPDDWVVEWSPEKGFRLRGTTADFSRERAKQALLAAAPRTEAEAMTAEQLCAAAGMSHRKFYYLAKELLAEGRLTRKKTGARSGQYRYWAIERFAIRTSNI